MHIFFLDRSQFGLSNGFGLGQSNDANRGALPTCLCGKPPVQWSPQWAHFLSGMVVPMIWSAMPESSCVRSRDSKQKKV